MGCTVTGWGTTSEGGSLGRVLQKVDVPVVSDDDCRDAYGSSSVYDSMICAGFPQGGKDSCQGDSGPLHVWKPALWYCVLGIRLCRGWIPRSLHSDFLLH